MLTIDIRGLDGARRYLGEAQKQARYATAVALTRTAQAIKAALPAVLERELDRPTQFTRRGIYVRPARRDYLVAEVGFQPVQARYLRLQIEGGTRTPGARGIKLPGNITLDSFGNIPRGTIDKLKAAARDGSLSTAIRKRIGEGGRRKGQGALQLFVGKPEGRGWENAPLGIWRRIPGNPGKLVPVIVFADKPARYRPRFHFREAALDVVRREWPVQFGRAWADAMRTTR